MYFLTYPPCAPFNPHQILNITLGHAAPTKNHEYYFDGLSKLADSNEGLSFVYMHGDHHRWKKDRPFDSKNILRVMLDQGAISDPLHVRIDVNSDEPTIDFDRRPLSKMK